MKMKREMSVQSVLMHNITSENRMRRYFLKCVVNSVSPSPLLLANRKCRGSRCLLGLVTMKKWYFFLLAYTFVHFAHQIPLVPAEKPCSKDCVCITRT